MTRVNTGVKFEYDIRDHYEAKGFEFVRAAGSRGAVDLIVWNEGECHIIQAKKEKRKYPKYDEDIEKIRSAPIQEGWKRLLIVKHRQDVYIYDVTTDQVKMQTMSIGEFRP